MQTGRNDVSDAFVRLPVALFFAWSDTKARYKRSFLGPFWLVLSTAFGVVGMGLVWSILLKVERADFIPSLTIGLVVWQLISGCIQEGTAVFFRNAAQIKDINLPSFFVSLQLVLRQTINFAHNLVVFLVVLLVYPEHLSFTALWALPGLALVILNLLWLVQILGYFGARYRDLEPLVNSIVPILFFLSPVIYRASELGAMEGWMSLNPLTYWIGLIRDPFLGLQPAGLTYLVVCAETLAGWTLAIWLTSRKRHRLPFWI
jgi:ABC-type polysaccharide/polyol phosphate export permease